MSIKVTSDAFADGQSIPVKYTRDGANVSPPLKWEGLPAGTEEIAVVCEDPDAPRDEPWVHWVAFKIPPDARGLPEGVPQKPEVHEAKGAAPGGKGARPSGVELKQGTNTYGSIGWDGPAPPPGHGPHHYHIRVYALDRPLEIGAKEDAKSLAALMTGHVLDEGEVVGVYQRA